ncbi:MAG: hypothetical protein LRY40_06390 [Shewanella fodinae]|nr:hypothetical protein [Shewanella fodinae]
MGTNNQNNDVDTSKRHHIERCRDYVGIGSPDAPNQILRLMEDLGRALAVKGLTLRTGGELGPGSAFEKGCARIENGCRQVFLPWSGFNHRHIDPDNGVFVSDQKLGSNIASRYYKGWRHLKPTQKLLIGRVSFIVLGRDSRSPARFLLCWTADGTLDGSTCASGSVGQALRIAYNYRIPVYNLQRPEHLALAQNWIQSLSTT